MKDYFAYVDNFAEHAHIDSINITENDKNSVLYSIIITTYRRPLLLQKAIESALNQKLMDDYEVVVVDNDYQAEPTATSLIVEQFNSEKLRYFQNRENLGMFGNWNRGLILARGRWVTILHDDDLLLPEYLHHIDILRSRNNSDSLLSCNVDVLDQRASSISSKINFREKIKKSLIKLIFRAEKSRLLENYFYGSPHRGTIGILFRRDLAIEMGGFDPSEYPSADYFFFAKYVAFYQALHISKYLAVSRISENESLRDEVMVAWVRQCYEFRKYLARRYFYGSEFYFAQAKLLAVNEAIYSKAYWGGAYDEKQVLRDIGIDIDGWIANPMVGLFYKNYLLIRRLVR